MKEQIHARPETVLRFDAPRYAAHTDILWFVSLFAAGGIGICMYGIIKFVVDIP